MRAIKFRSYLESEALPKRRRQGLKVIPLDDGAKFEICTGDATTTAHVPHSELWRLRQLLSDIEARRLKW